MSLTKISYRGVWYKAKDVIAKFGLSVNNVSNILSNFVTDDHKMYYHDGSVEYWVVDKYGIYRLLLESKSTEALEIKNTLVTDVIPYMIVDDFYEFSVSINEIDGNSWYKSKGCIEKLEYAVNNVTNIVNRYVDKEHKKMYFDGKKSYWVFNQVALSKLILQSKSGYSNDIKHNLCLEYLENYYPI